MSKKNLIGSRMALFVSDPWEFGSECGTGPFVGTIKDEDNGKALVRFDKTISYGGTDYSLCICFPRHQGKDINDILNGTRVSVNVMLISAKDASLSDVNQQSLYKTQAVIGTIEQAKKTSGNIGDVPNNI
ncbi:MAG TPA: hypothetical protein PLX58_07505 [Smithellaceae bacterium]|jgi:hypothetical protein|nr:hypothetical protein [Smithellaceae bacterium]HQG80931.1 hypothetical protein [Smithellaceae bacterium]